MDATTIKNALHKGEAQLLNKLNLDEVELILPVPIPIENEPDGVTKEPEGLSNGVIKEPEGVIKEPKGLSNGVIKEQEGVIKEISDTAKIIFDVINDNPNVTMNELIKQTGISFKTIQKHIKNLKQLGFIERVGGRKFGYWKIIINNNL